jgi:hypothetical protein
MHSYVDRVTYEMKPTFQGGTRASYILTDSLFQQQEDVGQQQG